MTTDLTQAHRDFPATERWTYMDVSARGLLPRFARDALVAHLDERMNAELDKHAYFDTIERVRGRLAQHLHAARDEIAFTKNVTEGLAAVAASIDWRSGDNLIVCPEIEHPANVYVWLNLQRRGVEIRMVAPRTGTLPVDEAIARIDERTRVLACATVSFAPGFRTDLAALGAACRARGVLLVVDAAQSVGVLDDDVAALNIDALAASTQKGLLGLYGMGFLYCRREVADRLQPAYLSRFGVDLGDASEADLGSFEYRLAGGARRFDLGNYNFTAAVSADAILGYLAGFGQQAIERYALGLSHRLARGLIALGLPVSGGEPGPHLAHIVTVGEMSQGGHDSTSDARMQSLHDHLTAHRVKLSIRRGVLRFSLHLYNTERDVDRVLDLAAEWSRRGV
ncbi:MAG: aminotransferase class V-fold PLP-dependent enzyme [Burkholderiales bacterium]|nr:aminotransferase class V-fold PLP-dependent enzyme [Burkholderiales bacterium]